MAKSSVVHATFVEQGAFLDGYDDAGQREHGTNMLMEQLGAFLERRAAVKP
jgi:hypothetical protein